MQIFGIFVRALVNSIDYELLNIITSETENLLPNSQLDLLA